jgi:hypothetical protein
MSQDTAACRRASDRTKRGPICATTAAKSSVHAVIAVIIHLRLHHTEAFYFNYNCST